MTQSSVFRSAAFAQVIAAPAGHRAHLVVPAVLLLASLLTPQPCAADRQLQQSFGDTTSTATWFGPKAYRLRSGFTYTKQAPAAAAPGPAAAASAPAATTPTPTPTPAPANATSATTPAAAPSSAKATTPATVNVTAIPGTTSNVTVPRGTQNITLVINTPGAAPVALNASTTSSSTNTVRLVQQAQSASSGEGKAIGGGMAADKTVTVGNLATRTGLLGLREMGQLVAGGGGPSSPSRTPTTYPPAPPSLRQDVRAAITDRVTATGAYGGVARQAGGVSVVGRVPGTYPFLASVAAQVMAQRAELLLDLTQAASNTP